MAPILRGDPRLDLLLSYSLDVIQRQCVRLFRELPNRNQAAQRDQGVDGNFHHVFVSLFRLNQKPVGRFLSHTVSFCCEDAAERSFCLISLSVIIAFEHWMRGRVETDSK